jgi:hypothetical protein
MDPQSELISNTLALNVALKTMKERCLSLQQRLIQVEKENVILKTNGNFMDVSEYKTKQGSVSEIAFLRAQNQELLNQKSILSENIKLISKVIFLLKVLIKLSVYLSIDLYLFANLRILQDMKDKLSRNLFCFLFSGK